MKNIFVAAALTVAALGFTACSSDDDNNVAQSPMVGEWKAQTVSYVRPDTGEIMTHDFSMITNGCDVDELELRANNVADLEIESKVNDVCVEAHKPGTWSDAKVTIEGEELSREVISITATELVLKYNMTWGYGTTDVTVKYVRS